MKKTKLVVSLIALILSVSGVIYGIIDSVEEEHKPSPLSNNSFPVAPIYSYDFLDHEEELEQPEEESDNEPDERFYNDFIFNFNESD